MPIEVAIWNISNNNVNKISYSTIESEKKLETILKKDIRIISDELLIIGNQVRTPYGKCIDILAVDSEGKLVIIELKKNRTPREVVAQAIDYASWVQNLSHKEILEKFKQYNDGKSFEKEFTQKFDIQSPEDLNQEHEILIVCAELDTETERIINYLSENYDVPINALFFRCFQENGKEYLTSSWLIDPREVNEKKVRTKEAWNGKDFVCNVDAPQNVSCWEDCVNYSFISAGGGKWYSNSLKQLYPGARIFAMIPKKGYVGVGEVLEGAVSVADFIVECSGRKSPIMEVPLKVEELKRHADDPEKCEYFVRVKWNKTIPESKAYWEKGMRANQNSAFKLQNEFTLEKLIQFFGLKD